MKQFDIVYILKNDIRPDELRYSLRSLDNFPHSKVWFAGGIPEGLKADGEIPVTQTGCSKYSKARSTFQSVINNPDVSDDFWLFNDDFFVVQPITEYEPVYDETLFEKIIRLEDKYGDKTAYTRRLRAAAKWLRENGFDVKNYELHMPMLFNKQKLKVALADNNLPIHSMYGNMYEVGKVNRRDVKIIDTDKMPAPDCDFLSTSDLSFRKGKVGNYIRSKFNKPCKYEVTDNEETDL